MYIGIKAYRKTNRYLFFIKKNRQKEFQKKKVNYCFELQLNVQNGISFNFNGYKMTSFKKMITAVMKKV